MPERQFLNLSKRIVDRLAVDGKDAVFWDCGLPGFGVRVYPIPRFPSCPVVSKRSMFWTKACSTHKAGGAVRLYDVLERHLVMIITSRIVLDPEHLDCCPISIPILQYGHLSIVRPPDPR